MKGKFKEWYADQITKQLQSQNDGGSVQLKPVDMGLPSLKELGAKWLVETADYIANNPQYIIVNGFMRAGISGALDGKPVRTRE